MNKKTGIIIILTIALVAVAATVYFVFFKQVSPTEMLTKIEPKQTTQAENETPNEADNSFTVKPVKEEIKTIVFNENKMEKTEITKIDLSRIASSFAERFGSYSNQSNYTNVNDLKIFMSQRMKQWADNYVVEAKAKDPDSAIYYGVTTKAIQQNVLDFDSDIGNARILVKTQRREATGTMSNSDSFYQDIIITFIKENNIWKVDSANWQST